MGIRRLTFDSPSNVCAPWALRCREAHADAGTHAPSPACAALVVTGQEVNVDSANDSRASPIFAPRRPQVPQQVLRPLPGADQAHRVGK